MILPSYLTSPLPGSHLVVDSSGTPVYQGDVAVTFTVSKTCPYIPASLLMEFLAALPHFPLLFPCFTTLLFRLYYFSLFLFPENLYCRFQVLVPHSVANGTAYPALAVQYGHGLFGDQVSL